MRVCVTRERGNEMEGAREYAELFTTGQYGKLYIVSGDHARGRTFRIQVLPAGEKAIPNGESNLCLNNDAVLVYGERGGRLGWTEYYGWIHKGTWEADFERLVLNARTAKDHSDRRVTQQKLREVCDTSQREERLLSEY